LNDRLPSALEATALMRQVGANGGFAHVLHKGDAERGVLVLLVAERGAVVARLERQMAADFTYVWTRFNPPDRDMRSYIDGRTRIDPDFWLIELDVPDAERFIAETMVSP
jgi:hypothetical protein